MIEYGSRCSQCKVDCEALCSDVERQDLSAIRYSEARPGETSDAIEQEDHCDYGTPSPSVSSLRVHSGASCPYCERDQHPDCSDHEEHSSADLVDKEGEEYCNEEGPNLKPTINKGLVVGTGNANRFQDAMEIV